MSKFTEELRTIGIINNHDFASHGNVVILYSPNEYGRGSRSAQWIVYRPGYQTAPDAHWTDYGNKTFTIWGNGTHKEVKEQKLAEAKEWCEERYDITEWAKNPFGGWMDAAYVKTRVAELKALLKDK